MSNETSKCYSRRYAQGHLQKLKGVGYDIGGGSDTLNIPHATVKVWDKKNGNGNAEQLYGVEENSLDFIYSSHTLEHMANPIDCFKRWINVVKSNGYLYIAVPDYNLYEGGEKITNPFHKCAFSINKNTDKQIPLYNIIDFLKLFNCQIIYIALCDDNYNYSLPSSVDQTKKIAVCHIEFMIRKGNV